MEPILFRELPGVAEIEQRVANSDRLMKDELDQLRQDLDQLSVELFGITAADTYQPYVEEGAQSSAANWDAWQEHFAMLGIDHADEDAFWEAVGLDLNDEEGEWLACYSVFTRQIICAVKGLHPRASFRFRDGTTPEQSKADAEVWLAKLLAKKS